MFVSYLRVDGHDEFDELDGLEFFDGFDSQRPLAPQRPRFTTASSDLSFDSLAGLLDLNLTI